MFIAFANDTVDRQVAEQAYEHIVTSAEATATTLTLTFADLASIDGFMAFARTTAGLQKAGLIYTRSGNTITVANNGSTTTLTSADVVTILAFGSNAF